MHWTAGCEARLHAERPSGRPHSVLSRHRDEHAALTVTAAARSRVVVVRKSLRRRRRVSRTHKWLAAAARTEAMAKAAAAMLGAEALVPGLRTAPVQRCDAGVRNKRESQHDNRAGPREPGLWYC